MESTLKLCLSTGTLYPYPLRTVLRWAREAGFDGVEVVVNPEAILRGGQGVRRLADAAGTELFSVHPTVIPLPGWRERVDGPDATIRWALEADARHVVLHTPRSERLDEGEGLRFQEAVRIWKPQLAGSRLRLAIENKAIRKQAERRYALSPLGQLRLFADRYDVDLVLDTVHAGTAGEDLQQAFRTLDGRLANVHLSDMGGRVCLPMLPYVRWVLEHHRYPGQGHLPLAGLLTALSQASYQGLLTLELNPVSVQAWWPPVARRHLLRAAAWIRQATR